MEVANKIKLRLGGIEYLVNADEDEAYVVEISRKLNEAMERIQNENSYLSTTMVAILAALEFCDEATKVGKDAENLRQQMKEYIEDAAKAAAEANDLRKQNERLKQDVELLLSRK